jgi:hypothetical protein
MPLLPLILVISTERNISKRRGETKESTCDYGTHVNKTRMQEVYFKQYTYVIDVFSLILLYFTGILHIFICVSFNGTISC